MTYFVERSIHNNTSAKQTRIPRNHVTDSIYIILQFTENELKSENSVTLQQYDLRITKYNFIHPETSKNPELTSP